MATITTAIKVQDAMTPAFHSINTALNIVLNNFESLQNTTHNTIDTVSIQQAREELRKASSEIIKVEENIKRANNGTDKMPQKFSKIDGIIQKISGGSDKISQNFNKANNSASNFIKTLMGFNVIQRGISMITSQIDSAISRIDTLNNYPKVMSNLGIDKTQANASKNMLSDGLKGLPTILNDAVGSVQRFTSANNNVIASTKMFLALNNAILAGGAEMATQQSALEQLSQAYAKGKPDMTEWRSAMSAMPAQLRQVATAMNFKSADALGEALRNGKVSMNEFMNTLVELNEKGANGFPSLAEQARNATGGLQTSIDNMKTSVTRGIADMITNINEHLENMGVGTIQDIITNIGTGLEGFLSTVGNYIGQIITALSPLYDVIQQIINFISSNSSTIGQIISGIINVVSILVQIISPILSLVINIVSFILDNMSIIAPIIMGIIAIVIILNAKLIILKTTLILAKVATAIWTTVQAIFNAVMAANPIVKILIVIIAIIAVIYVVIAVINKVTNKSISATGVIMGVLFALGAFFYNTFIVPVWNAIAWLVNFFANCFKDPVATVKILFAEMALWVLNKVKSMIEGIQDLINLIPGVQIDITSGIDKYISILEDGIASAKEAAAWEDVIEYKNKIDLKDAYSKGYEFAEKINEKFSNMFKKKDEDVKDKNAKDKDETKYDNILNNVNTISDNTGKIKNSLEVTEEDLQYLRDIAERDTINRFTTAEIKVDFTSNNNINSELDLDGIVDSLGQKLEERLEVVAEGVYA